MADLHQIQNQDAHQHIIEALQKDPNNVSLPLNKKGTAIASWFRVVWLNVSCLFNSDKIATTVLKRLNENTLKPQDMRWLSEGVLISLKQKFNTPSTQKPQDLSAFLKKAVLFAHKVVTQKEILNLLNESELKELYTTTQSPQQRLIEKIRSSDVLTEDLVSEIKNYCDKALVEKKFENVEDIFQNLENKEVDEQFHNYLSNTDTILSYVNDFKIKEAQGNDPKRRPTFNNSEWKVVKALVHKINNIESNLTVNDQDLVFQAFFMHISDNADFNARIRGITANDLLAAGIQQNDTILYLDVISTLTALSYKTQDKQIDPIEQAVVRLPKVFRLAIATRELEEAKARLERYSSSVMPTFRVGNLERDPDVQKFLYDQELYNKAIAEETQHREAANTQAAQDFKEELEALKSQVAKEIEDLEAEIPQLKKELEELNQRYGRKQDSTRLTIEEVGALGSAERAVRAIESIVKNFDTGLLLEKSRITRLRNAGITAGAILRQIETIAHTESDYESGDLGFQNIFKTDCVIGRPDKRLQLFAKNSEAPFRHVALYDLSEGEVALSHQVLGYTYDKLDIETDLMYDRYRMQPEKMLTSRANDILNEIFTPDKESILENTEDQFTVYNHNGKYDIAQFLRDEVAIAFDEIITANITQETPKDDILEFDSETFSSLAHLEESVEEINQQRREVGQQEITVDEAIAANPEAENIDEWEYQRALLLEQLQTENDPETVSYLQRLVEIYKMGIEEAEARDVRITLEEKKRAFRIQKRNEIFKNMNNSAQLQFKGFQHSFLLTKPVRELVKYFSTPFDVNTIETKDRDIICSQYAYVIALQTLARLDVRLQMLYAEMLIERKKLSQDEAIEKAKNVTFINMPEVNEAFFRGMTPPKLAVEFKSMIELLPPPKIYTQIIDAEELFKPPQIEPSIMSAVKCAGLLILSLIVKKPRRI